MIKDHRKFLDDMSDGLKTTNVLDGFMNMLKAINSYLTDFQGRVTMFS
jgi:cysteinyl-tRNA synthetase